MRLLCPGSAVPAPAVRPHHDEAAVDPVLCHQGVVGALLDNRPLVDDQDLSASRMVFSR